MTGGSELLTSAAGLGVRIEVDGPVLERYLVSRASVVVLIGPVGSGKSRASIYKLLLNALRQKVLPGESRARRRTYVVRNTFDELDRTVVKDWVEQFPESRWGRLAGQKPKTQLIRTDTLEWEVTFLALDEESDAKKLLSAQVSDIWINEAKEVPREILLAAKERVDRWPNARGDCYRPQVICDTNAAAEDHWISIMSGQAAMPEGLDEESRRLLTKPDDWEFLIQPPAMLEVRDDRGRVVDYRINPDRENARHTSERYYRNLISGATRARIAATVLNRPAIVASGRPVWPEFNPDRHVASGPLLPIRGWPVLGGFDFGRTPAALFGQVVHGRWRILREYYAENIGAKAFARLLKPQLAQWFPGFEFSFWGDPRGEDLSQADDISPYMMFRAEGMPILPAPTNDPTVRINAISELFLTDVEHGPRIEISPACVLFRMACAGGYQLARIRTGGGADRYADVPVKNRYSHIADAAQYMVMGAGEGAALFGRIKPGKGRLTPPGRVVQVKRGGVRRVR